MKARVLHVIPTLEVGGAQALLYNLWPSLGQSERYDFDLCVIRQIGAFGEKLRAEGTPVHCLGGKRKYDPISVWRLRRLIRRGGYRIVHAHLFPEFYMVALATIGVQNVRLVFTEHGAANRRRKLGIAGKFLDQLAYARYQTIVSVNASTCQNLTKWQPQLAGRAVVIPNGIRAVAGRQEEPAGKADLLSGLGMSYAGDTTLILFAGRLLHLKGIDVLLTSLATIRDLNFSLLIAGDGEERQNLEAMARSLGLSDRVRFLGQRPDVLSLLRQVDFLVLPSRREGLPIIILEAMASGCPIIGTSIDGMAEVLQDRHSALLVPADNADELATAIRLYIKHPEMRTALAGNAQREVKNYLADNSSRKLIAVYDQILAEEDSAGVSQIRSPELGIPGPPDDANALHIQGRVNRPSA